MQTDPIGYADGMNLYRYVVNDPINAIDPSGLSKSYRVGDHNCYDWTITHEHGGVSRGKTRFYDPISPPTIGYGAVVIGGQGGGGASRGRNGPQSKKLPPCAQNFLKGRISSDPGSIVLHDGGSILNNCDNSVTYGNDIYLTGGMMGRHDENAMVHKFHEIQHTSQNARMGITALTHAFTYFAFWDGSLTAEGIHDASPLEKAADDFAQATYDAYHAAGLDKTCPF